MQAMTERIGAKFERLVEIMQRLRAPDGCPWDREQTLTSLRPYVLEETYEVLEAIDHGSAADLREELGDFLFEAVFLAQLSDEAGDFNIGDSIDAICDKLVRRHPHVFAREAEHDGITSGRVLERWEQIKAQEREAAGKPPKKRTTLSGVPQSLPALLRAQELSERAARVGFDWQRSADVLDKIEEEVAELRAEFGTGAAVDPVRAEDEMGDLLFAIANLSRKLGIEPEAALRRANDKFTRRFDAVEEAITGRGKPLSEAGLEEMEAEWQRAKKGR